jgi:hypothetical protein
MTSSRKAAVSLKMKPGDLVGDLGDHVQKRHPLAPAERGRERQALTVGLDRPRYDLPRVGALQKL